jgi:hypothetical protein
METINVCCPECKCIIVVNKKIPGNRGGKIQGCPGKGKEQISKAGRPVQGEDERGQRKGRGGSTPGTTL